VQRRSGARADLDNYPNQLVAPTKALVGAISFSLFFLISPVFIGRGFF
jgi:hypothetical protein